MLGYALTARRASAKNADGLRKELRYQTSRARVKLRTDSGGEVLCAWKTKLIYDTASFGRRVNGGCEKFEKKCL